MNQIFENYLFDAFANASDTIFIYVTDMKQDITRWSQNAVKFFDLADEYTRDTASLWLSYIHPDDRQIYLDDIMAVMMGTSAHHNCQYRARNRYGEYVWVECRGSLTVDNEGQPAVFAGIMTWLDNQNKYDSLTHLLTSYELMSRPLDASGTMMVVGIDDFRNINSQHGILYGNKILVRLSQILVKEASDCVVYRFQGDEFVIYGKKESPQDMVAIFRRALMRCSNSENEAGMINFSVSAGVTTFTASEGATDALARAELCLNYAKENSSTHVAIFSAEIEKKQNRRNLISEELIRCIKDDFRNFYLVFQPIFDSTGTRIEGCESLLRWKPDVEEIGSCGPGEFIPILERNGGIIDIGYFVVREALKQMAIWQKKYHPFYVSFNVSYLELEDPKFIPAIIDMAKEYGVDASNVVVELTESILVADPIMVKTSFDMLKQYGIKIALDDFGTGTSSFWTLHNINVDIVKLDQSFIRGLVNNGAAIDFAIVESVGLMCRRMGLKTVAEGVETETIWSQISKFDFGALQGYYFSHPIEKQAFEELLDQYE